MSIDCNQGTNIKLFPELCCSKGLISLLFHDIMVKLLVIACTFRTPIVLMGSKTTEVSASSYFIESKNNKTLKRRETKRIAFATAQKLYAANNQA